MSHKSERIAAEIRRFEGRALSAHYLGFFDCFNRQLFYEAHDVLEDLWLPVRRDFDGDFYKGLIQLAGAFVHVQKGRRGPALALLTLARNNLVRYEDPHHSLSLKQVVALILAWEAKLAASISGDLAQMLSTDPPHLELLTLD